MKYFLKFFYKTWINKLFMDNKSTVLENIFGDNHHPMMIYDKATMLILAVNDLAVSCYGYSHDEFIKMNFKDLIT
ncbi:MAG: hypothetical protein P4L45_10660, partial [Ignavibacteriaceae bacterium]|nr:hypothetical protein [Ignavibacteriaceae bacterium]